MRITGGQARGRLIAGPIGLEVRPTASKIRQAFFNILANKVPGCRFLDVCAGSGLIGAEAISRGAASLIAVEENKKFAQAIEGNLRRLGFEGEVVCGDLRRVLPILGSKSADIIFADPPYKSELPSEIIELVAKHDLLNDGGILIVEHAVSTTVPQRWNTLVRYDSRKYGQTMISFYHCQPVDIT